MEPPRILGSNKRWFFCFKEQHKTKMKHQDNLENLRHSAAHLLASAVLELYPGVKNTIGPAIENGFYYDFDFSLCSKQVLEEDLPNIEQKMRQILKTWKGFKRKVVTKADARKLFKDNPYKLELVEEIASKGETLRTYTSGKFEDLCRGGHATNPKEQLKNFKLLNIAGAYWKGNEKNSMLTRIYGTLFPTKEELDQHLAALEEAKQRDHRKIGLEQELFTFSNEIGPGLALWLPKGTIIKDQLENLGKETELKLGYQRVSTPHIAKEALYVLSGHLPYYKDDMYPPMHSEEGDYYLKPMNCPHMHMIYKARTRSYKEFPVKFAEFGTVYRYEDSGALFGLMRVRGHTQNDAHIYCSGEGQAVEELVEVMRLHEYYFGIFDIRDYFIELALPDFEKKKDKYFGNPQAWKKSIALLKKAAKQSGARVIEDVGGAAFYGPKFDFGIKSTIGRKFSITTNQLDFGSGERFCLKFTSNKGKEETVPYIIHRAPLGSDERFIGYLIEHYAGAFPVWLAPVQVIILPITDRNLKYAQSVEKKLKDNSVRVEIDERAETLQAKIRDAQITKVPYMLITGDREQEKKAVAVRLRTGENLGAVSQEEFFARIKESIEAKSGL